MVAGNDQRRGRGRLRRALWVKTVGALWPGSSGAKKFRLKTVGAWPGREGAGPAGGRGGLFT